MALIHHTTLKPSKLELLASWLPEQPWYRGNGAEAELSKAGGFRLDDPDGEVGIEFMVVRDDSGSAPLAYHVPLSYRGAPLEGAEDALIGTSEHGVLGQRWIYDGTRDPVLVGQLFALLLGETEPQAQSVTDTPDPSVSCHFAERDEAAAAFSVTAVASGPEGTDLLVQPGPLTIRVNRVLEAERGGAHEAPPLGHITAGWLLPDGTRVRGVFAVVQDSQDAPSGQDR